MKASRHKPNENQNGKRALTKEQMVDMSHAIKTSVFDYLDSANLLLNKMPANLRDRLIKRIDAFEVQFSSLSEVLTGDNSGQEKDVAAVEAVFLLLSRIGWLSCLYTQLQIRICELETGKKGDS